MEWYHLQKKSFEGVKAQIFKIVLVFAGLAFSFATLANTINGRPAVNIWLPLLAAGLHGLLFFIYTRERSSHSRTAITRIYMAGLAWVYLPLAWLTSPGSYSAMPYYALAFIVIMACLTLKSWEYVFAVSSLMITILLFHYEVLHPGQFSLYSPPKERALDLSIHFFVASTIMIISLYMINRSFRHENQRMYDAATTDPHTGLYNRRFFYDAISHQHLHTFCLVLMDLNNFKRINDIHGHPVGDEVLLAFSRILKLSCREEDLAIRYGGDEFILLLHHTTLSQARALESRIRHDFRELEETYKHEELSISFGYATHLDGSIDEIILKADQHLYQRKPKKFLQESLPR
ncbi:diguanylate cyclase (GGDEF) domain-containing protein [Alkalispirochaeta americana]|uniref:diguanylate cyclase n=1 Tax=Alkalispirochaeta americana TaxID=159291 RepID=A0A1N6U3Q9_9SPIO|nr:GGDEF domain-containing protein [Alkalispirochaeta americana]SIQ60177.1 diguanylate cyclase (GGDEF) domain-containing protein [Alkalispirochaeta americana]